MLMTPKQDKTILQVLLKDANDATELFMTVFRPLKQLIKPR